MTPQTPTIAILPLALPEWQNHQDTADLARGLAALMESRLRMLPNTAAYVQHLIYAPEGDPGRKGFLVRRSMWSVDEALDLPQPDGVEATHVLHGRLQWNGGDILLTIELIDALAAFAVAREEIHCAPAEFPGQFFALLGRVTDQLYETPLNDEKREPVVRVPTPSFDALLAYMKGVSRTIALQIPVGEANPVQQSPFPFLLKAIREDAAFAEPVIALNMLAREWFSSGDRPHALAQHALREALTLAPGYAPLKGTLGRRLFEEGQLDEAQKLLEEFVASGAGTSDEQAAAHVCLGAIRRAALGPAAALEWLEAVAHRYPGHPDMLECMGVLYTEEKRPESAKRCWERVLEDHPRRPVALSNLGQILWEKGDLERARILLERSVEDPSASSFVWSRLLDFLEDQDDLDAADEFATDWAEHRPESWQAWVRLARIRHQRGDSDAAKFALSRAEKTAPTPEEPGGLLARTRFLIRHPDEYEVWHRHSSIPGSAEREIITACVAALKGLAQRHPGAAFIHSSLAEKLLQGGRHREAAEAQAEVCHLLPESAAAHNTHGYLSILAGDRVTAIASFREAVRLSPSSLSYRTNLIAALVEDNALESAAVHLRAARSMAAADPMVKRLEKRLHEALERLDAGVLPEAETGPGFLQRLSRWFRIRD